MAAKGHVKKAMTAADEWLIVRPSQTSRRVEVTLCMRMRNHLAENYAGIKIVT